MKVFLIGFLEHLSENKLRLFTLTKEHGSGADHVLETEHCFLDSRVTAGLLP